MSCLSQILYTSNPLPTSNPWTPVQQQQHTFRRHISYFIGGGGGRGTLINPFQARRLGGFGGFGRTAPTRGIIVEQNRGRTRPKDPRLWCAFPLSAHAPRTRALSHFLRATE